MNTSDNKNFNNPVSANVVNIASQPKEGVRFLGCCDMRRAVLILNILSFIQYSLTLLMFERFKDFYKRVFPAALDDDPELEESLDDLIHDSTILIGVGMGTTALSIYGAYFYQGWAVALNGLYTIIFFIVDLILAKQFIDDNGLRLGIFNVLISAVLMIIFGPYPHFTLAYEMYKKIMTKETYPREEMSCCCV